MKLFGYPVEETTGIGLVRIVLGDFGDYTRKKESKMKCRRCGKKDNPGRFRAGSPYVTMMIERELCFTCAFWEVLAAEHSNNPLWCRIEGVSYIPESMLKDGQKSEREWGKGFGGAEFHIEMDDGTKFRTDNLWCQGRMPRWMKDLYPDNAKFSTDARYSVLVG